MRGALDDYQQGDAERLERLVKQGYLDRSRGVNVSTVESRPREGSIDLLAELDLDSTAEVLFAARRPPPSAELFSTDDQLMGFDMEMPTLSSGSPPARKSDFRLAYAVAAMACWWFLHRRHAVAATRRSNSRSTREETTPARRRGGSLIYTQVSWARTTCLVKGSAARGSVRWEASAPRGPTTAAGRGRAATPSPLNRRLKNHHRNNGRSARRRATL